MRNQLGIGAIVLGLFALIACGKHTNINPGFQPLSACPNPAGAYLTWDASTGPNVTGYKAYYGTSSGVYTNNIDVGNVTYATICNLTPGQTFYFMVTAYNSCCESGPSNEVSKTMPTFLQIKRGHSGMVMIKMGK